MKLLGSDTMAPIDERYYEGFWGEDEIFLVIKENDIVLKGIGFWEGHLFDIMYDNIKPAPEGWKGLPYYYHVEGLYAFTEKNPWKVDDLPLIYEQFSSVTNDMLRYNGSAEVLELILDLIKEAMDKNQDLYLYEE